MWNTFEEHAMNRASFALRLLALCLPGATAVVVSACHAGDIPVESSQGQQTLRMPSGVPTGNGFPPPSVCTYGGRTYTTVGSFPASDGCNSCSCQSSGEAVCTEMVCARAK